MFLSPTNRRCSGQEGEGGRYLRSEMIAQNLRIVSRRMNGAFTLIELLVVIVIIGILASAVVGRLPLWTADARFSAVARDLRVAYEAPTSKPEERS